MDNLTLSKLKEAVGGPYAAMRAITRLEPAGGPSDKLFPPTFVKEGQSETKYAMESRRVDGREVRAVLLDSVASQANRMEEALLEAWRRRELDFPVVQVDFSKQEGLEDLEQISALQAPHRIADAILRDSVLDGKPFRHTEAGVAFTESSPNRATGIFRYCPTALVFGVWDSTGPRGGLGAKFQRCLTSEIVGLDAIAGVKTASRIDPVSIQRKAGPIFQKKGEPLEWTLSDKEAEKDKNGKPVPYAGGKDKGLPSAVNHGNIPPSLDAEAGGVTVSSAQQTIVLSLTGLRRLRFPTDAQGRTLSAEVRPQAEGAARTALAALGLAAVVYQRENGFDLRSRCVLVGKEPLSFDLLSNDGAPPQRFALDRGAARTLVAGAQEEARKLGLGWDRGPIDLTPAPKLVQLIRHSRDLLRAGAAAAEE
jgi:CRISPR-associated protein Csb1